MLKRTLKKKKDQALPVVPKGSRSNPGLPANKFKRPAGQLPTTPKTC